MIKLMKNKKKLLNYNIGSKYNLSVKDLVNEIINKFSNFKEKKIIKNYSKNKIINQKLNHSKIKKNLDGNKSMD